MAERLVKFQEGHGLISKCKTTVLRGGSRGRVQGVCTSPPLTTGILQKKKTMWFIGVEVEQEMSAPPPKKILDPPLVFESQTWDILIPLRGSIKCK